MPRWSVARRILRNDVLISWFRGLIFAWKGRAVFAFESWPFFGTNLPKRLCNYQLLLIHRFCHFGLGCQADARHEKCNGKLPSLLHEAEKCNLARGAFLCWVASRSSSRVSSSSDVAFEANIYTKQMLGWAAGKLCHSKARISCCNNFRKRRRNSITTWHDSPTLLFNENYVVLLFCCFEELGK